MRYFPILILIFMAASLGAADFQQIELPTKANINAIYFNDNFRGWAVTSDGELLTTADGGQNWKLKEITSRKINDIHFIGKRGYLAGERGLLMQSNNMGATWKDMSMQMKFNFTAVRMVNDTSAMVCGTDQNSIAKTRGVLFGTWNHGKSWEKQRHYGNGYLALVSQPPNKVYLLATKKTFHSISQGIRFWEGEYAGKLLAYGTDFVDDWGYMVGRKGYFSKTIDHGRTWAEVVTNSKKDLLAVALFDKESGVAVGQDGIIIYFSNFADAWIISDTGVDVDLTTVVVTEDKVICGGKKGTIVITTRQVAEK